MPDIIVNAGGTDWLTPTATLLAVVIGGLVNWFAQSKLADRRAEAEAAVRRKDDQAEAAVRQERAEANAATAARIAAAERQAAARIVQGDLAVAASRLQNMVERDHTWYGYDDLRLGHWEGEQRVLARDLDPEAWEVVSQSALELRFFSEGMQKALAPGGPHVGKRELSLSPASVSNVRTAWENASDAHRALAKLAGAEPEEGLLHEGAP